MSAHETPADAIREAAGPDWRRPRGSESAASHLTLRDYFAARAMQAMTHVGYEAGIFKSDEVPDEIAGAAYEVADAMLKARQS